MWAKTFWGWTTVKHQEFEFFLDLFVTVQHISLLVVLNFPWEDDSFSVCKKRQVVGHLGFYTSQGLGVPNSVSFVPIDRCTNFKERTFLSNFCRHINFPNCQSSWLAFSTNGCMMAVYRTSLSLGFLCELYRSSFTPVPWDNSLNAYRRDPPKNSLVSSHSFQSFLSTHWCYVLNKVGAIWRRNPLPMEGFVLMRGPEHVSG